MDQELNPEPDQESWSGNQGILFWISFRYCFECFFLFFLEDPIGTLLSPGSLPPRWGCHGLSNLLVSIQFFSTWSWSNNSLLSRWEHRVGLLWGVSFKTQRKEESMVGRAGWWWAWHFREGCSICCHSCLPATHLPGTGPSPHHSRCHHWHCFCWLRSPDFPSRLCLPHTFPNPQLTGKSSHQAIINLNNWK